MPEWQYAHRFENKEKKSFRPRFFLRRKKKKKGKKVHVNMLIK